MALYGSHPCAQAQGAAMQGMPGGCRWHHITQSFNLNDLTCRRAGHCTV